MWVDREETKKGRGGKKKQRGRGRKALLLMAGARGGHSPTGGDKQEKKQNGWSVGVYPSMIRQETTKKKRFKQKSHGRQGN